MERSQEHPAAAPTGSAPLSGGFRSAGHALLFLGAYFLIQILVTVPYALAVALNTVLTEGVGSAAALAARISEFVTEKSLILTAVIDLLSLGAFALILRCMHRPVLAGMGFARIPFGTLLPLIPLGVALNVFLSAAISFLPADMLAKYTEASSAALQRGSDILTALLLAVLAPLTEEILFRGLIYGNLRNCLPRALAVALSAAVFGLLHGQLLWMAYTALLGACFCIVFERFDSLFASVLLHMSFNAGSFLVLMLGNLPVFPLLAASGAVCAGLAYAVFCKTAPHSPAN